MRQFVIQHGFLQHDMYKELKATFPKKLGSSIRSHADLYVGDADYPKDGAWRDLHDRIYNGIMLLDWYLLFGLDPDKYNHRPHFHEPRDGVLPDSIDEFMYSRMDISLGLPGYGIVNGGRGVHIDNRQRIISGLLYFTDQSELTGGEFDICNEDGKVVQRVPLSENMAIISLQNNDAWHKVNPLLAGERRAVYFALSATWPVWDR